MLGKWMFKSGEKELIWVPHNVNDATQVPAGATVHRKSDKVWNDSDWGVDEYRAIQAKASLPKQAKKPRPPRAPLPENEDERKAVIAAAKAKRHAERQVIYEQRKAQLDLLHEHTMAMFKHARAWDLVDPTTQRYTTMIYGIMEDILDNQASLKLQKNAKLTAMGKTGTAKEREIELRKETTYAIPTDTWEGPTGYLAHIDNLCKRCGVYNTLGLKLPAEDSGKKRSLYVAGLFLAHAKEVIMNAITHELTKKAKEGTANPMECGFVNASHDAWGILRKIRGKDSYPKKLKSIFEDSRVVEAWTKHVRAMERAEFKKLHPKKELPKHLHDKAPPQVPGQGKKGANGGGSSAKEIEEALKIYQIMRHLPGNHQGVHHSARPPSGKPHGHAAGRGRGGGRGGGAGRPPAATQSYMQGYSYYCD